MLNVVFIIWRLQESVSVYHCIFMWSFCLSQYWWFFNVQLAKRHERREEAQKSLEQAEAAGV